jgi:hypothetical protein
MSFKENPDKSLKGRPLRTDPSRSYKITTGACIYIPA